MFIICYKYYWKTPIFFIIYIYIILYFFSNGEIIDSISSITSTIFFDFCFDIVLNILLFFIKFIAKIFVIF